jgi:hypothetical protein
VRGELLHKAVVIGTNYHRDGVPPFEVDPQSPLGQTLADAVKDVGNSIF